MTTDNYTNCLECGNALGKRQKMFCSNTCKLTNKNAVASRTNKKEVQDKSKLIKCKIDGKTFTDLSNYSGALTRHLSKNNIITDNVFDYFELVDNPANGKPLYHCKYCDWTTIDVTNKSGWITVHLKKKHNILPSQHLVNFPDDNIFGTYNLSPDLREMLYGKDENSFVECKECNVKYVRLTDRHLKMHGLTGDEYKEKHGVNTLFSPNMINWSKQQYLKVVEKMNKNSFSSKAETEIIEFLKEHHIHVVHKNKTIINPHELDIFLPDYNIAIEYNGLFYHSEFSGKKLKDYHLNKTLLSEKNGVTLIHIFEDEWLLKKNIVKNRLLHITGNSNQRGYARKCTVKEIVSSVKNAFLNKNHIQGEDKSKVNVGLYDNGSNLVSVMTFSGLRKALGHNDNDNSHFELSRFATVGNITGAASKLLSFFIKKYKPNMLISYADRRWTSGIKETLYDKLGFKKTGETSPNYWYTRGYHKRTHRFNFTKHRIVSELGGDVSLTEVENMVNMGYDRIWDCGSFRYEMELSKFWH